MMQQCKHGGVTKWCPVCHPHLDKTVSKHEDLFESIEILYKDCCRMKRNAKLKSKEAEQLTKIYEAEFFKGAVLAFENTERLLKEIIIDYNKRLKP